MPLVSLDSNNGCPLCSENTRKSFTEPGSVAKMRNVLPGESSFSAFFAFNNGIGHFKPFTSRTVVSWESILRVSHSATSRTSWNSQWIERLGMADGRVL